MKKLMMFVAVVVCAAVTQAAQFDWSISQVREGWADNTVKADGTAYLFLVGSNGATEAAVASAISAATDASALGTTLSSMSIDSGSVSGGAVSGTTGSIDATAPADLFFVVLSDDGYAYQGAATTVTSISAIGSTEVAFGSQKTASSASAAWTNVGAPEPTSGILLLVGMGLLGLRRKRA